MEYISLAVASRKFGGNVKTWQYRCRHVYEPLGIAFKDGKCWRLAYKKYLEFAHKGKLKGGY